MLLVALEQAGCWPLDLLRRLGDTNTYDPARPRVDLDGDWIAVQRNDDSISGDYEPAELLSVQRRLGQVAFYLLEGRHGRLLAKYIMLLPDSSSLLIDNDHGWIDVPKAYQIAIQRNADWLYAQVSPVGESSGSDRPTMLSVVRE